MNGNVKGYETEEIRSKKVIMYTFLSSGKFLISKAIQYRHLKDLSGQQFFELTFGNYDVAKNELSYLIVSNNEDVYEVFNTVLSTIPVFFKAFPNVILLVRGSDGSKKFEEECRRTCKRKCRDICRKRSRRISIYRKYINKNLRKLIEEYDFWGGWEIRGKAIVEPYSREKDYAFILLRKK